MRRLAALLLGMVALAGCGSSEPAEPGGPGGDEPATTQDGGGGPDY